MTRSYRNFRRTGWVSAAVFPWISSGVLAQDNVVGACGGVQLPASAVTDVMTPVVEGVVAPIESRVNDILGVVSIVPIVGQTFPDLSIDTTTLLANAAAGAPVTLQVLNENGVVVGPGDRCDLTASSYQLDDEAGIAIGGNRISGLGAEGNGAVAGEIDSIAFGNRATTDAAAAGAIAIGADATVGAGADGSVALGDGSTVSVADSIALGAGSIANRGAQTGYSAVGLGAPQSSGGEVSIGSIGNERQLTNVAAGSAGTDAVNVAQLQGVADQVSSNTTNISNVTFSVDNLTTLVTTGAVGPVQYAEAATPTIPSGAGPSQHVTLVGAAAGPVGLHNVATGQVATGSTDAVNGAQVAAISGSVASALGGGAGMQPGTGEVTAPNYVINGTTYTSVGGALAALAGGLTGGGDGASLAPLGLSIASYLGGGVSYDGGSATLVGPLVINGNNYTSVAGAIEAEGAMAVRYDDAGSGEVTLAGVGGTIIGNLAAGALSATSQEAVNGGQLYATNLRVTINETAIANLEAQFNSFSTTTNGGEPGPLRYSDAGSPTTPNGGSITNDVTLVGAGGGPVSVHNVADGDVSATSTDAVNGRQLHATNMAVANAQATADTALEQSALAVRYDDGTRTSVTLGPSAGGPVAVRNVARGTAPTDAVNVQQLNEGIADAVSQSMAYTDLRLENLTLGLDALRRDSFGGTAAALAAAGMPQANEAGKGMLALGISTFEGQQGVAVGFSHAFDDGETIFKLGGTYNSRGQFGTNAGVGWQF